MKPANFPFIFIIMTISHLFVCFNSDLFVKLEKKIQNTLPYKTLRTSKCIFNPEY